MLINLKQLGVRSSHPNQAYTLNTLIEGYKAIVACNLVALEQDVLESCVLHISAV